LKNSNKTAHPNKAIEAVIGTVDKDDVRKGKMRRKRRSKYY
jgi:hypothetical protein